MLNINDSGIQVQGILYILVTQGKKLLHYHYFVKIMPNYAVKYCRSSGMAP